MSDNSKKIEMYYRNGMYYPMEEETPHCPVCYLEHEGQASPMHRKFDSIGRVFYECSLEDCWTSVFP